MQCTFVSVWEMTSNHQWVQGNAHPCEFSRVDKNKIGWQEVVELRQVLNAEVSREIV